MCGSRDACCDVDVLIFVGRTLLWIYITLFRESNSKFELYKQVSRDMSVFLGEDLRLGGFVD